MRLRRILVGATVLAVAAGGGYAAWAQASEAGAAYRTARVTRGNVQQLLDLTGTLAASGTQTLSFGTSGTVASVGVRLGQTVKQGQLLATLDRTSLQATADKARASLAAARAQLEDDEDTQDEQVAAADEASSSSQANQSSHASSSPSSDPSFVPAQTPEGQSSDGQGQDGQQPQGSDPTAQLHDQQQAVTQAQSTASQALAAAQDALTAETQACTAAPADQACADALAAVQTAQQQVATAQTALEQAMDTLTQTLTQAVQTLEQEETTQASQQPSQQPSQQSSPQSQQSQQSGQSAQSQEPTITAATLARDQADIEQGEADVVAANQALSGAVLRAPKAGRVAEVDVDKGSSTTAGGSAFVVVAPGTTTVTLAISATQLRSVKVGQKATVTPVGSARDDRARVSYVDPEPDSSTGSTTYAVTVTLDQQRLSLPSGAPASVSVVVGRAGGVLTVPTSAVSNGRVSVLAHGEVTARAVTTGIVGSTRTEITDGLSLGDEVVVADLNRALPTTDSTQQNQFRGPSSGLTSFGGNTSFGGPVGGPGGP